MVRCIYIIVLTPFKDMIERINTDLHVKTSICLDNMIERQESNFMFLEV